MGSRRATERDRDRAVAALRTGWVAGAVSTETFDSRLGLALRARWRFQLRALTRDLPTGWRGARRTLRLPSTAPPEAPASLVLHEAETDVVLGRHRTCDRLFPDDTVSRRHAELRRHAIGWTLRDLGSTNGTWLNGVRISGEVRVVDGDEIRLGALPLLLRER